LNIEEEIRLQGLRSSQSRSWESEESVFQGQQISSSEKASNTIRFIDLFGGVGGFRLGLERAGENFKCVWYNDIDKWCTAVYNYRFKESWKPADIKTIDTESIPDFDLLCAGFPCQSFSIAGKRRGFEDTRGTLFFEICRIAEVKRPELLLLENVKGLLSHDRGKTFQIILESLAELGYILEWQVLNSKHFGVPQNRERVFIVGHLGKFCGQEVFPLGEITREVQKISDGEITHCITSRYCRGTSPEHYFEKRKGILIYDRKGKIRRLTPRECERLQGFPDDWTRYGLMDGKIVEISDTQRYKMMGNAVTVNVVEAIGRKILKVMG
jgi:DNA (cytosine-5)-methyltransferase 1